jgi:hypothetical protein
MIAFNWNPSPRTLRQFAAAAAVLLIAWAMSAHARGRSDLGVGVLIGLAVGTAAAGALRPRALRLPYVLLTLAVSPIGLLVSQLTLLLLFYGVITPLGLAARLLGSDWLGSERRSDGYWRARSRPRDPASYLRQA